MSQDTADIVRVFAQVVAAGITLDVSQPAALDQTLRDCARSAAFIESVRLRAITRLDQHVMVDTNQTIITTSHGSKRRAQTAQKRADAAARMPALADALASGSIASDHVDAVAQTLSRMDPTDREKLVAEAAWITATAARTTPEQLAKTLQRRARELSTDDGIGLLERQRRNTYLRFWTDPESGMVCLRGEFDPETGARLVGRIRNSAEALFHDRVPDTCPLDERKNDHLRALALIHLTEGTGGRSGRPDLTVVIDLETLLNGTHPQTRVEADGGVTFPVETIRRMACFANIIPAVLGANGVLLDLGRSQRLATPHQRRALRVLYQTCAVGGCGVGFEHCTLHHISYWRSGGRTDVGNLLPLCSRHHHLAHEGGWRLSLDPESRALTVIKPDGTRQIHPPPLARAG
jgi:Domain of unknown function (DUF222)